MKLGIISPRLLIRRALSTFLASTGTALVVLEGSSLPENLEELKHSQADTLIFDACGPQGVEILSELNKRVRGLKILVLMDDFDNEVCVRALQLGAWACLSTRQGPIVFQKALNATSRGERWTPDQANNEMAKDLLEKKSPTRKATEELTPREWEVLGLLANGFRNKEISSRLSISEETAKSHVKSIYRKLNIKGRRDAIFRYFEYLHRPLGKAGDKAEGRTGRSSSVRPPNGSS